MESITINFETYLKTEKQVMHEPNGGYIRVMAYRLLDIIAAIQLLPREKWADAISVLYNDIFDTAFFGYKREAQKLRLEGVKYWYSYLAEKEESAWLGIATLLPPLMPKSEDTLSSLIGFSKALICAYPAPSDTCRFVYPGRDNKEKIKKEFDNICVDFEAEKTTFNYMPTLILDLSDPLLDYNFSTQTRVLQCNINKVEGPGHILTMFLPVIELRSVKLERGQSLKFHVGEEMAVAFSYIVHACFFNDNLSENIMPAELKLAKEWGLVPQDVDEGTALRTYATALHDAIIGEEYGSQYIPKEREADFINNRAFLTCLMQQKPVRAKNGANKENLFAIMDFILRDAAYSMIKNRAKSDNDGGEMKGV